MLARTGAPIRPCRALRGRVAHEEKTRAPLVRDELRMAGSVRAPSGAARRGRRPRGPLAVTDRALRNVVTGRYPLGQVVLGWRMHATARDFSGFGPVRAIHLVFAVHLRSCWMRDWDLDGLVAIPRRGVEEL